MAKDSRPVGAFIGVLLVGFAVYFGMVELQDKLTTVLFDYNTWFDKSATNPLYRFFWMIGDSTEPHFHKTLLGGIGVLIGSIIAYVLDKKQSRFRGIPISYGTGKWPWIFAAGFLSLGISVILFGGLRIEGDAWIPTFIPYVSVASAVILIYGGNLRSLFTGAIFGALFTTPITMWLRYDFCLPLGLPGVIASVSGMWIGGIFVFELCKILPWMTIDTSVPEVKPLPDGEMPLAQYKVEKPNLFFIRRMLADYSEPMFVGNEIAGGALILGSILTWFLSPMQPYYGTGWFPALLLCQIITGAVAIFVYWPHWRDEDFFPSFVPVVSVAPAMVLTFGPSMFVIIFSAILGGLLCPPIANMVNRNIPSDWHPMVGFTFSMAFCSLGVALLLKYLLMAFPCLA
ncbi:MAG: hypothetical protein GXX09_10895 [Syntrophomonadaceae bacterium]|nr:hypothetical protein [Syntrophomonadaceae bacterium]